MFLKYFSSTFFNLMNRFCKTVWKDLETILPIGLKQFHKNLEKSAKRLKYDIKQGRINRGGNRVVAPPPLEFYPPYPPTP